MFLYVREDDQMPFGIWRWKWCRLHILENGGGEPEAEELDWTVEQLFVGLMGNGEVEGCGRIQLLPQKEPVMVQNIESAKFTPMSTEELENRPGIVGYFVKNGIHCGIWAKNIIRLWKKYKRSESYEEDVNKGDKILILSKI